MTTPSDANNNALDLVSLSVASLKHGLEQGAEESGPLDLIFTPIFTFALLASFTHKPRQLLQDCSLHLLRFFLILIFLALVIYIEALLV